MKKPILNQIDREILITDPRSSYSSRIQFALAWLKLKREIGKKLSFFLK